MLELFDSHTHNGYSRCVKKIWTISDGWRQAKSRGLKGLGITNHVHFNSPRQEFLAGLRDEINRIPQANICLGVELDIDDPKGRIMLQKETLDILDYVIAGPHNMPTDSLNFSDIAQDEIEEYFSSLRNILVSSLKGGPIDAWVHPFYQELHFGAKFWPQIAPIYAECLEICANRGIALELTEAFNRDVNPIEMQRRGDLPAFKRELTNLVEKMVVQAAGVPDLQFTLASDAHNLAEVGNLGFPLKLVRSINGLQSRLVHFQKSI